MGLAISHQSKSLHIPHDSEFVAGGAASALEEALEKSTKTSWFDKYKDWVEAAQKTGKFDDSNGQTGVWMEAEGRP